MNRTDPRLINAESIALDRLVTIVRDSECEHEARLAAEAIFKLRREADDEAAVSSAPPAERPAAPQSAPSKSTIPAKAAETPLTTDELADLMIFLPGVAPQRFIRKHSPVYWRRVLADQRQYHARPSRAQGQTTGPPSSAAAA